MEVISQPVKPIQKMASEFQVEKKDKMGLNKKQTQKYNDDQM